MHRNFTQLYVHCVWGTWDRLPMITPEIQEIVYSSIVSECNRLECKVLAIGGIQNHVHLLAAFPPKVTISNLMFHAKGSTSHLISQQVKPKHPFKWQGGYGAFTVAASDLERLAKYIHRQAQHHAEKTLNSAWEIE
jgi:putative transposase